jgi:hypothetical protein
MKFPHALVSARAHLIACAASLLLLTGPTALSAQQSGTGEGRFGTRNFAAEATELPDGTTIEVGHYYQVTFADDPSHPMDDQTAECVGQFRLSADGNPLSASGICYSKDVDGDGISYWWRLEAGGTADCPNICGVFGYLDGFGKFEGITGEGTWRVTAPFEEGNLGVWESSYSIP